MNIKFLDLNKEYLNLKKEIDKSISNVLYSSNFIKGNDVLKFEDNLKEYTKTNNVISCGNGTDALQASLMAYSFPRNSEILLPSFTYIATAEVISLLGLKPVFVDVNPLTFNIETKNIESKITKKTVAIIPVNLYGQSCDISKIILIAKQFNLKIIEDNAQSFGADITLSNKNIVKVGTLSDISTTSFFPSKSLGCFGDGGAVFTSDYELAKKIRMICNHGQTKKYYHEIIGVNSRLDTIQASILNVKLKILDSQNKKRIKNAEFYNNNLNNENIILPRKSYYSNHIYHQYTIKLNDEKTRNNLQSYLHENNIPTVIYYPKPIHLQKAYRYLGYKKGDFIASEKLSKTVLSLPIHPELEEKELIFICRKTNHFFKNLK
tara:strand:+ start:400 stop:1533 length:1134 start_codon:yes stop_codon:yes gene_type:complete